jgi:hypothetical protein
VSAIEVPGGTLVTWTGNTNCGGSSHFGISIENNIPPTATNLPGALYSWTYNGAPIGQLPTAWQTLTFDANGQPGYRAIGHIAAVNFSGGTELNTLDNYTVTNDTSQVANDFETFIGGITNLNEIGSYYTTANAVPGYPAYPNVTAQLVPGGAVVTWTGSQTRPGDVAHFGIRMADGVTNQPMATNLPAAGGYWTSNSNIIGEFPIPWISITPGDPLLGGVLDGVIVNPFNNPVWVQRRVNFLPVPPNLEDLTVASTIWTSASNIDAQPFNLGPGSSLTYEFQVTTQYDVYILGYELYETSTNINPDVTCLAAYAVAFPQPVISSITVSATDVVLTGSNGYEGFHYIVESSTNLPYPAVPWPGLFTDVFDIDGQFTCTLPLVPGVLQQFYRLQTQ